jgi:hypothetical protein
MNGRVYDPELGRFLSPDPNVQFVADLQNYNRYSYVRNNPLRYTDPTGYAWYSFVSSPKFWMSAVEMVASIGCTAATGGGCAGLALAFMIQHSVEMYASGASLWQVAAVDAVGYFAGAMGGQLGGAVAGGIGGGLGQVLGGAAGGAVSAAISTEVFGGKNLGTNILAGALSGAASAGLTLAIQGQNPLSIADRGEQRGGGDQANLDGSRPSEELKSLRRAHLLDLIDKGGITEGRIGDLPVAVWGGSDEARDQTLDALRTDLSTERGQQMLGKLSARLDPVTGQTQTLDVFLDYHVGGSYAQMGGNTIVIDTAQVNGTYFGSQGAGTYDYERILAHELGHAVYARTDYFNLNTIENENKIMGQLGYTNDRYSRYW